MYKTGTLTAKQTKAIELLLMSPSLRQAAQQLGMGQRTVWRWMQQPAFQAELRKAQQQLLESNLNALQVSGRKAIDTLTAILDDRESRDCDKIQSARSLLEYAVKYRELELEARLERIEEAIKQGGVYGYQQPHRRTGT